jgi:anthranilate phosphoribosyltransferase
VTADGVTLRHVRAADLGLRVVPTAGLAGGTAADNAAIVGRVFAGEHGPHRDVVVLNAAAGFLVAGRVPSLADGVAVARETIDLGSPGRLVERLRAARAADTLAMAPA